MTPRLLEAVILDSVAANNADITFDGKTVSITGQANSIDLKRLAAANGFTYKAYAAGTAKVITIAFQTTATTDKYYDIDIIKAPVGNNASGLTNPNIKYTKPESYTVYSGASGTAKNNAATALYNKLLAWINSGNSPWASVADDASGTVTLTAADPNFQFIATCKQSGIIVVTESTPLVQGGGTTTIANTILNQVGKSATSGKKYATYIWQYSRTMENSQPEQTNQQSELVQVYWFVDSEDADFSDFNVAVTAIAAGDGPIGAVSQATSNTTGVTLNAIRGTVTTQSMNAGAAGATPKTFTVSNSYVHGGAHVDAWIEDYAGTIATNGNPQVIVDNIVDGAFDIIVSNLHGSNALSGVMKIGFRVTY